MELGVEDGDAGALGGEGVAVGARGALDQPVEAKAAQVVTHLRRAVGAAGESGDVPAKAFAGDAGSGVYDEAECTGQGHGALIPEAQPQLSGALCGRGPVTDLELGCRRCLSDVTGCVRDATEALGRASLKAEPVARRAIRSYEQITPSISRDSSVHLLCRALGTGSTVTDS